MAKILFINKPTQALPYDPAKWNSQDANEVKTSVNQTIDDLTALIQVVNGKAPINSPALTGIPLAPTAAPGTATNQIATTQFVDDINQGGVAFALQRANHQGVQAISTITNLQTELNARALKAVVNVVSVASYSLLPNDNENIITFTSATDVTITIPSGLPLGFHCIMWQNGVGQLNFVAGSGAVVFHRQGFNRTMGQGSGVTVNSTSANFFNIQGDME